MAPRFTVVRLALAALALASAALMLVQWQTSRAVTDIGFWYDVERFDLPGAPTRRLGGRLTAEEVQRIVEMSRRELATAFNGFRVRVTDSQRAFWRVAVSTRPRVRSRVYPPSLQSAGETMALGPLGGAGTVDFTVVASSAVRVAPPEASRAEIVDAIGRGIGRVAAHEVAHQIVEPEPGAHNDQDEASYEYPTADRAAQFYGDVRWTTAWPILRRKLGG